MHIAAPPKVSPETIAAFFAAMRLWLLEAVTPLVMFLAARSPQGRELRAWLDADVREATRDVKRMLFAMAVSQMAPRKARSVMRGRLRPSSAPAGFRPAARSRNWFRLTTRICKSCGGVRGRLALLRDLIARPDHWAERIATRLRRIKRSRKGARFVCVAPPAVCLPGVAPKAACADTS